MKLKNLSIKALYLGLILALPVATFAAPETGDTINRQGVLDDDYYAAGGTIFLNAEASGDVVVFGGDLSIEHKIQGDVIAAGGTVNIRGEMMDDVRTAGGEIQINASIGDDLIAAGGKLNIAPGTSINGDAWLAGGTVHMAGTVKKDLFAAGGNVRISGRVQGNARLEAEKIEILDGAVIEGDLFYKSPEKATIHPGAKINGKITYEQIERETPHRGYGLFFSITMMVSGIALFLLFPGFTMSAAGRINSDPLRSLGLGFAVFAAAPVAAVLLISLVVSLWIGLSLLAIYFVALHAGFLISFFFLADLASKLIRKDMTSKGRRILSLVIVILILGFIQMIPVIGGLIVFSLMLLGLGAGIFQLHSVYTRTN